MHTVNSVNREVRAHPAGDRLRESDRLRQVIDVLPAAIYTTDADGRITHFNSACVEFSGQTPELGTDHWCVTWKLFYPDGRPMPHHECPMAVALRERRIVRGEEAIAERPDGTRIWFEPYPTPLFDETGELVGGVNMLVDITERKEAEIASANLAAIVASSDDAIVGKNLNGIITSWNVAAQRTFGYTAEEAVGRSITMLIPEDRRDEESDILARIKRGQRVEHFETKRRCKDGSLLDVSLTISPVKDRHGRVIGASKIARDITERKRIEAELHHHRQHLQELVNARTAQLQKTHERLRLNERMAAVGTLAAGLAHDMSNLLLPLDLSVSTLLTNQRLDEDVHAELAVISALLDHLREMSRNLALFSRDPEQDGIAGHTDMTQWRAAVHKLLNASVGREIAVTWDCCDDLPPLAIAPHRLTQAVQNLMHNARDAVLAARSRGVCTTPSITVQARAADDGRAVIVKVIDNGIGMDEETRRRCIEPFFTTHTRPTTPGAGSGLGLSIAHQIVERIGGSMAIDSEPGHGATITLTLPRATPLAVGSA